MKVAILGYDTEGKISYNYYAQKGYNITICDQNSDIDTPIGINTQLGDNYLDDLDKFDILVRTAGLHPNKILIKNPGVKDKIISGTNEFFKICPTTHIIGVTGTKGKGTTSTLITTMLQASGFTVHLGGNIGIPALDLLPNIKPEDWVVLELSSFQLIDIKYSPHIGVCLLVVPEHLDWHTDLDEYIGAKSNLFKNQSADDLAIYYSNSENSKHITSLGQAKKLPYFEHPGAYIKDDEIVIDNEVICKTSEIKLLGEHNWQNVCAAITATWQVTQNIDAIKSVIINFSGLEHRLELVRVLNGVKYYDDSFGTTPETAIVAIKAFKEPKVLILGGSDKGADYNILATTVVSGNVKKVLLIGDQADRISKSLISAGFNEFTHGGKNMNEIVNKAQQIAQTGDIVLLSTGCASFDMFKNYKDRANQFIKAVQELA